MNTQLTEYIEWAISSGDVFARSVVENLARYPVSVTQFITDDEYLGLKNVYPAVLEALSEIYHPEIDGLSHALRVGTAYREVVLTGGIGCAKTYTSVLGSLYGAYLLSCFTNPHAVFGLDRNSEIVFLFQSIRFQTGGVAYNLAREIVDGSSFFTKHFPKNKRVKNEIQLPLNIVFRPVSGDLTAAIGMNVVTVVLDELSFMKYHTNSVYSDTGGDYDQAKALYGATRSRIDSRFAKMGRYLIPMWLAGSARHEDDFIQTKIRDHAYLEAAGKFSGVYVYNKTIWEIKPWDYPSGETFRVYLGHGSIAPRIVEPDDPLFAKENVVDVPVELEAPFRAQPINAALRDVCGVAAKESGSFVVETDRARTQFNLENLFTLDKCTMVDGDFPSMRRATLDSIPPERPVFCHIDFSRTRDSTGIALGYVEGEKLKKPVMRVFGVLEVRPVPGRAIPWDAVMLFIYRLSKYLNIRGVSTDQVAYHYVAEQLHPLGYRYAKISDNPSSDIFHQFLSVLLEGDVQIATHRQSIDELIALNVDEKTGKVSKPAGGNKDCIDAIVGVVALMKKLPMHMHHLRFWSAPQLPEQRRSDTGNFVLSEIE